MLATSLVDKISANLQCNRIRHLGYRTSFTRLRRLALTNVTYTKTRLNIQGDVLSERVYYLTATGNVN
jgi:hypothetical protein